MLDGDGKMKPELLTEEEMSVITNPEPGDIVRLQFIKGMTIEEMREFDRYTPLYMNHYVDKQKPWLETEKHLLFERPCNNHNEVPEELLIEDFEKCHNGERFRVFYVLKYSDMVKWI